MSAIGTKCSLAAILLIASAGLAAAQDQAKPVDVATYPAIGHVIEQPPVARPLPLTSDAAGAVPLAENAYDFNNPDSIPGFGTLPPNYDTSRLIPRMASE